MRQKLTEPKEEKGKFTIIPEDFNTPLQVIDRKSRQKMSKDVLNNIINQIGLIEYFALKQQNTCFVHVNLEYSSRF